MSPVFRTLVDVSIWLLFVKALLMMAVTLYTFGAAYLGGEGTPAVGVACCAAGTFAFGMTCVAIWVRKLLD
jgi:hypothetical protein